MTEHMITLFEQTVACFPERTAIADPDTTLSFSQLRELARRAAVILAEKNPSRKPVCVMAERNVYTVVLFLAVLYSGACYLPLDPNAPEEKRRKIIEDSGAGLTVGALLPREAGHDATSCIMIDFEHLPAEPAALPAPEAGLLYLIYTSGSTGTPKGIAKSHRAMADFISAYIAEFGFDETTMIGNQTPFYFDASAKDLYLMVACGASIEILPTKLFSFPVRLVEYMNERRVNFISWVPSALSIVAQLNTFSEIKPRYLKRVSFVGEVFPVKHLNKWLQALPDVEFVNLYGSSEMCGIACFYRVPELLDPKDSLPLGAALGNCEVRLVADGKTVDEPNAVGEIYVCANSLAEGYYKDSERTARSFVTLDLGNGEKRYYRTGDLARYDDEHRLVFASRSDYQIKHMGHRIELGEIEHVALTLSGMERCCCLYREKQKRIVLFCQPEKDSGLTEQGIRAFLKTALSDYMQPHKIVISEQLPLNANGKIDRATLAAAL